MARECLRTEPLSCLRSRVNPIRVGHTNVIVVAGIALAAVTLTIQRGNMGISVTRISAASVIARYLRVLRHPVH
jgi:hypothetical protein